MTVRESDQSKGLAHLVGSADTRVPEIGRQFVEAERQDTNGDRADLPMTDAKHFVCRRAYANQFTFFWRCGLMGRIQYDTGDRA